MVYFFERPDWVWALLALLPVLFSAIRFLRNRLERPLLFLVLIRTITVTLLVLAAMGPARSTTPPDKPVQIKVLLDNSASVDSMKLRKSVAELAEKLAVWQESTGVKPDFHLMDGRKLTKIDLEQALTIGSHSPAMQSPIFESIQSALESRSLEYSTRYLVLSDGNDTKHGTEELSALASHPVWWIPLPSVNKDTMRIRAMQVPAHMLMGQEVMVEVLLECQQAGPVRIDFFEGESKFAEEILNLEKGLTYLQRPYLAKNPGMFILSARINPEEPDPVPGNNQASTQIRVTRENTVLSLARTGEDENLRKIFEGMGFKVVSMSPDQVKSESLQGYSAVMIQDLKRSEVGDELEDRLQKYVSNGGGLGVFGGPSSYGLGGWFNSKLEEVLPVYCPPRSYRGMVAIALIIDSSGSMLAEDPAVWSDPIRLSRYLASADPSSLPINAAKRAALQVVKDLVGVDVAVISFADFAHVAMSLRRIETRSYALVERDISVIRAGGGTKFQPALRRAVRETKDKGYEEVHFIFLSDGVPTDQNGLNELLLDLKQMKISVSTIAFGKMASRTLLASMAETTGGKFFNSDSVESIGESFREAVERVFGPPVRLDRTRVWPMNHKLTRDPPTDFFEIIGLNSTRRKERADVLWQTDAAEPVLAVWQYGLGQSFAWMSDLSGAWTEEVLKTDRIPRQLALLMPRIMKQEYEPLTLRTMVEGNRLRISLTAVDEDGEPLRDLQTRMTIQPASAKDNQPVRTLELVPMGEGLYLAETVLLQAGTYRIEMSVQNDRINLQQSSQVEIAADSEVAFSGINQELFSNLERDRKGSVLGKDSSLQPLYEKERPDSKMAVDRFAHFPAVLAAFLLCVEVLLRRSRVLEQIGSEKLEGLERSKRLCRSYVEQARTALAQGDSIQAEKYYLAAHRLAKSAKDPSATQTIWKEYRERFQ